MVSIFSKLFGGGGKPEAADGDASPKRGDPVQYEGYTIEASPMKDGEQWRLCGVITKPAADEGSESLERTFIRADLYPSRDEAETFAIRKGQQIIDQQGEKLFADGNPTGRA